MNIANIAAALAVMQRVHAQQGIVDMRYWRRTARWVTLEQDAGCGTVCCFGGWLALSPEWQRCGGQVDPVGGAPGRGRFLGSAAIADFLDIPLGMARELTGTSDFDGNATIGPFYQKRIDEITALDVVDKLEQLLRLAQADPNRHIRFDPNTVSRYLCCTS